MRRTEIVKIENKALKVNLAFAFSMAFSGILFGILAHSSAILLDGVFSFVIFLTMILSLFIQKEAKKPRDYNYPLGHAQIEELYILFKILTLLGILVYSFLGAVGELYSFFIKGVEPASVNIFYMLIYFGIKIVLFLCSLSIYNYFINKSRKKSKYLKVERMGVIVDGSITTAIAVGFFVLEEFESIKKASDPIILFFMSLFLVLHIFHEFREEIYVIMGKRLFENRELYYKALFNNYFFESTFNDVYIVRQGKNTVVSVVINFNGKKSNKDIHEIELAIKKLMYEEFDKVHLYTYYAKEKKCIK